MKLAAILAALKAILPLLELLKPLLKDAKAREGIEALKELSTNKAALNAAVAEMRSTERDIVRKSTKR